MTVRRSTPAWVVGVTGLAIGVVIVLRILIPSGMDPTTFLTLGEDSPAQVSYAQDVLGDVATRDDMGHDGKFFFAQANDPWYLEPEVNASVLDRPTYRGRRMLYPMIAGGFGLFPPGLVVWSLLVTNLLALGAGSFLAALLAERWGATVWLGLAVPLNIGLLFELYIDGAGIVAYVCCLGALYSLLKGRTWTAALLFAAACLSREVMIGFALGVLVLRWLDERRFLWRIVIAPLVAMVAWNAYLWFRLKGVSGVGGGLEAVTAPFLGLFEAFRSWGNDLSYLVVDLAMLVIAVLFVPLALRSRSPIAWGAFPFVVLTILLSVHVWREPFDLSRALAPVLTAAPFLLLVPKSGQVSPRVGHLPRGPACRFVRATHR
ncbi:MAG: hypothetical protein M3516_06940 [Actinomycetota bacterium]|nr:hypothetical protein [Actinomycetota bacterium]